VLHADTTGRVTRKSGLLKELINKSASNQEGESRALMRMR
jgi:hypothetical protein